MENNLGKRIYDSVNKYVDLKKGAFFGGIAGAAVGAINYSEGIMYAFSSGSKEFTKCMLVGSVNMGLCRHFATQVKSKARAYALATIVPAILSTALTYGVHAYLRGTPHPAKSTAPTLLSAPFFLALAKRERKLAEENAKKNQDLEAQLNGK